jgi:hypothetical protein
MLQQELLAEIEQLRERYAQQRKVIAALLKDLKTDHDEQRKHLNRYARIKQNYTRYLTFSPSETPLEASLSPEPTVEWLLIEAERNRVRTDRDKQDRLLSALQIASDGLRLEPPDVVKLSKAQETLDSLKETFSELPELLERYGKVLQSAVEKSNIYFGTALVSAFAAEGLTLEGRPPDMYVGRFAIKLNFAKRAAYILYGKEPVGKPVKLSAELIVKAYRAAHKEVAERQEDGAQWIQMLHEAWRTVRFRQGIRELEANLIACYVELALQRQSRNFLKREPRRSLFKEYTRAQFAYDVDLFIRRRQLRYDEYTPYLQPAIQAQTGSPETALWIVSGDQPDSGRYCSALAFKKGD